MRKEDVDASKFVLKFFGILLFVMAGIPAIFFFIMNESTRWPLLLSALILFVGIPIAAYFDNRRKEKSEQKARSRENKNAEEPLESHRVLITVSVAPKTARAIEDLSARHGISRGKIIDRAIQNFK